MASFETARDGSITATKSVTVGSGAPVQDQDGNAMVGPKSYDPEGFANAAANSVEGLAGFITNGPFDLQRTYNDVYEGDVKGYVSAFTPVASFASCSVGVCK